jgi:hypothetical protein
MESNQQNTADHGKKLFSWNFKEYEAQERSKTWYTIFFSALGLMMVYAVVTINFLFGIILVMSGIILMIRDRNLPNDVNFSITETGVEIDGKFFEFSQIATFYILYKPPELKNLYLDFKSLVTPRLIIPLHDQNPLAIRKLLNSYVTEDLEKEEEPLSEVFRKTLKF